MNFAKGLSNLFNPTYINFILALCLILILILIYLKTNKLELFDKNDTNSADTTNTANNANSTNTATTKPLISTILTGNNYLTSFINNYISKMQQQNYYKMVLATQGQTIQNLSQRVSDLINSSA
jgi:hypothetical protein